jgi:flavin-dependent thymidylate synthase
MRSVIQHAQEVYQEMSDYGVAKEQCRIHLPLALETKFIWTGSLQAFMHLCNLRLKKDAQKETRDLVDQMLDLVKNIEGNPFKCTIEAFGY